jgi:hypothetical protein
MKPKSDIQNTKKKTCLCIEKGPFFKPQRHPNAHWDWLATSLVKGEVSRDPIARRVAQGDGSGDFIQVCFCSVYV